MLKLSIESIDWSLLRSQKQWLLAQDSPYADGLIALLDTLQDNAVDDGIATAEEVFG